MKKPNLQVIEKSSTSLTGTSKDAIKLTVKIAETRGEIIQCQYLIAASYNRYYKIFFSRDIYDLEAKIEPYPHRYIMAQIDGELIGAAGLYTNNTYTEKFGDVSNDEIKEKLRSEEIDIKDYSINQKHEITKVVCSPKLTGNGIGAFLWGCANSETFLYPEKTSQKPLIMCCAKPSVFNYFEESTGIKTRKLKKFPVYKVHELYSAKDDAMESRIIIPEIDVPETWYKMAIPGDYILRKKEPIGKMEIKKNDT
ncbi:hypothetical protein DID77_04265 [Candidatus Marinamargulisbacteria bacterium SCGC AG-439-L15]|nr:hypothetical protein DID77_04265 [Candidatus Marinamargulisbacteria bacterium SCGC AG-439-L15]